MSVESVKVNGLPVDKSFEGLATELETVAVFGSAVPEINEDLRALSDEVDSLSESDNGSESGTVADLRSDVEDLRGVIEQLTTNLLDLEETVDEEIANLRTQQEKLEARLETVESCFSTDLLGQQGAHYEAMGREMPLDRGDERELLVEEILCGPNSTLRGPVEKVQTFVDIDDPSEYEEGNVIDVIITDLTKTAAHAAPAAKYGE